MDYKLAICDDHEADIVYGSGLVRKWAKERNVSVSIVSFPSAESFLFHYEEDKNWDILLLDIEMGNINGVELARTIRRGNKEVQIIFITGYMEYILDGYEVEALHYLIKPVSKEKVHAILDRAVEKLGQRKRALFLEKQGEAVRIPFYEITYLEVQKNYVTIHGKEAFTVKKTLGEIQKELDENFFRVGRSYIVNLNAIRKITKTDVFLKNGDSIPLPRNMYESLNRAIIQYL